MLVVFMQRAGSIGLGEPVCRVGDAANVDPLRLPGTGTAPVVHCDGVRALRQDLRDAPISAVVVHHPRRIVL